MAAPTLLDYAESVWNDPSATVETTDDLDWAAADVIVVLGATEDNGVTMATPTGTGITLSALTGLPTNTASSCKGYGWSGAVTGNGNSVLTSTNGASGTRGISAWAYSGSAGLGTPVVTIDTALTHNVTVLQDSSVVMVLGDWNATTDVAVTTVPAGGTIREAVNDPGTATFLVIEWANQAAGTRAYGVSAWTGTGMITKVTVEVKGTSSLTVSPSGIASAEAFGAAVVTTGPVSVAPSGIASAEAFGTAAISRTVTAVGISSGEAFGTPLLIVTVTVGSIPSGEQFGTPTVGLFLLPSGIASGEAFGTATVTPAAVTVAPTGVASGEVFGAPVVSAGGSVLQPGGIGSAEAMGAATVTTGPVTVAPGGIASGEAFGGAVVSQGAQIIQASGITGGEAFGAATVTSGGTVVTPSGIVSGEALGAAVLTGGEVVVGQVNPVGVPSAEAFGTPVVALLYGAVCVCPPFEATGPEFGRATITLMA